MGLCFFKKYNCCRNVVPKTAAAAAADWNLPDVDVLCPT